MNTRITGERTIRFRSLPRFPDRYAMSTLMLSNTTTARPPARARRVVRLSAVARAMASALAIWVLAELALGIDVRAPAFDGSAETLPIRAQDVILVGALLSFAGWGFIAVLEPADCTRSAGVAGDRRRGACAVVRHTAGRGGR